MNESQKHKIAAGTTSAPIYIDDVDATVTAIPGSSGTMSVDSTTSPVDDVRSGSATWSAWPSGSVSVTTSLTLIGRVTAVRATATTAAGTIEVCQ